MQAPAPIHLLLLSLVLSVGYLSVVSAQKLAVSKKPSGVTPATATKKPETGEKESSQQNVEDNMAESPHYGMITSIEDGIAAKVAEIWKLIKELSPANRVSRSYINTRFWPELLSKLRDAHFEMREMDNKILFTRKPSALMDALLKVDSLKSLQRLASKTRKTDTDLLTVRYFELSSAASQMHRFYAKRIRDILRDEPRIGMVAQSILNYKGNVWTVKNVDSSFGLGIFATTPGLAEDRLMYNDGKKDVFTGIRDLLMENPDVVMKAQYDGKICQENQTLFNIEPAGLDGPYYVLFHLCLTDIKFFVLYNFAYMYNQLYQGVEFGKQKELRIAMRSAVQKKIDLFDTAFGKFLGSRGPSYQQYPGVGLCDPPPDENNQRDWVYDDSYIKLTNFIKVFVAPEQSLHKAGNCKQTCDVLDATYTPCNATDSNCILDEELDCITKKKQCAQYDPPCPPRAYQCQNASTIVTTCPSSRHDRLYEYIHGYDFKFGAKDHECENATKVLKGNWKIEPDTLVDTPHYCDICTCYCFEPLKPLLGAYSVRYMSTKMSLARFKTGYIVVGIKFERVDDQIHISVADALPLPNKKVNASTIQWTKPSKIEGGNTLVRLNRDLRSFNLDDVVTLDPDRVVTGVGLYKSIYNGHVQYQYIGLSIVTHQIDEDGKLTQVKVKGKPQTASGKISKNANSTAHRKIYMYPEDPDGPDDPLLAQGPSLPDTTSNQYVVFVGSSLHKDAAQTTIPFFDAQKLIRREPKWLKGIGVYHKNRPGYGGFLAFKLIEHHDE